MKAPSTLGAAMEAIVLLYRRYRRYREPIQYLCSYKTDGGWVFAHERVTKSHITLWLPDVDSVRLAAEREGLSVVRSLPYPDPSDRSKYGRISPLKSIPELAHAALLRVAVKSVAEAMAVVGALS